MDQNRFVTQEQAREMASLLEQGRKLLAEAPERQEGWTPAEMEWLEAMAEYVD